MFLLGSLVDAWSSAWEDPEASGEKDASLIWQANPPSMFNSGVMVSLGFLVVVASCVFFLFLSIVTLQLTLSRHIRRYDLVCEYLPKSVATRPAANTFLPCQMRNGSSSGDSNMSKRFVLFETSFLCSN